MLTAWLASSEWIRRRGESLEISSNSVNAPAIRGLEMTAATTPGMNCRQKQENFWDSPVISTNETEQ